MGELAKKKTDAVIEFLGNMNSEVARALPDPSQVERFMRIAQTSIRNVPKLMECSRLSLAGAIMQAAQLGLYPDMSGQCYIIPYKNSKTNSVEAQFQIGYKGFIELFYRSEGTQSISAQAVYEMDTFTVSYGTEQQLVHKPKLHGDRGKAIGYYAVAKINNNTVFEFMSIDDIKKHKEKFSKGSSFSPWEKHFDEMAKKTVVKRLMKYMPLTSTVRNAQTADETTKRFDDTNPDTLGAGKDITDWDKKESIDIEPEEFSANDITDGMQVKNDKIKDA